jgi:hypothetical protein
MKEAFNYAYGKTLYRWHTGLEASAYSVGMMFIPTREYFIPLMGKNEAQVSADALAWKASLDKVIEALRPLVEGRVAKYLGKTPAPPRPPKVVEKDIIDA